MTSPLKIILDTDPGVGIPGTDADDPIALLLAAVDPRLELIGVTTVFGNCPPLLGARGAAAVLASVGREDVPIVIGAGEPLNGSLAPDLVAAYAGDRGRPGRIPLPDAPTGEVDAAAFLAQTIMQQPGEVTVVSIGPQTNLARAMQSDPAVADALAGIVFMGGALGLDPVYGRGNVTPVAECNIYYDAEAADIVFSSGVPLTMVSLDVTNPATGLVLEQETLREIREHRRSPAARMLAEVATTYLEAPMFDLADGCVLYDPLAVLAAADPTVGSYRSLNVAVELDGDHTRGQTVVLGDEDPNLRAMIGVDGAAAVRTIVSTILGTRSTPNRKNDQ